MLQGDAKTIRFRDKVLKKGGVWRDIYGIDEKKVASMVREDKVDILVELTGHTANNKLGTMACRPAPIQVCLGHCDCGCYFLKSSLSLFIYLYMNIHMYQCMLVQIYTCFMLFTSPNLRVLKDLQNMFWFL